MSFIILPVAVFSILCNVSVRVCILFSGSLFSLDMNYEDIKCIFNGVLKSFGDVGVVTYI